MEQLFQKPSPSASSGASGEMAQLQPILNQLEQYTGQQETLARGGIAGVNNPYFGAAQQMSPAPYRVNPGQTQTFGTSGPGTYLANLSAKTAGGATPPWQPVPRNSFGTAPGSGGGGGSNGKAMLPLGMGMENSNPYGNENPGGLQAHGSRFY